MVDTTREERIDWWRKARFGLFIHYGLYSVQGRHEWAMSMENQSPREYARLAEEFRPKEGAPEEWVLFAKESGMKYIVLTTRHHEGFSLWDSRANPFNAVNYGPKRDIVREFVEACRKHGMKIGFYSSLGDWRHPDSAACAYDQEARLRFTAYVRELNRELMSGYGKIDLLFYDLPVPMTSAEGWDALGMNRMVRELQPHILINDRSLLPEDFGTPEEEISGGDRDWEACMTFNGLSWGYIDPEQTGPYNFSAEQILLMLAKVSAYGGNLLLNMGPAPDGSVPREMRRPLGKVGRWLKANGEAVYGLKDKFQRGIEPSLLRLTGKGETLFIWSVIRPPEGRITVAGFLSAVLKRASLPATGEELSFRIEDQCIILEGIPPRAAEEEAGIALIKLEFDKPPVFRRASAYPQLHRGESFADPQPGLPRIVDPFFKG